MGRGQGSGTHSDPMGGVAERDRRAGLAGCGLEWQLMPRIPNSTGKAKRQRQKKRTRRRNARTSSVPPRLTLTAPQWQNHSIKKTICDHCSLQKIYFEPVCLNEQPFQLHTHICWLPTTRKNKIQLSSDVWTTPDSDPGDIELLPLLPVP